MKQETKQMLIGAGIGITVGAGIGGVICWNISAKKIRKRVEKEAEPARKRAYHKGYDFGYEKAIKEAQEFIDQNTVNIDPDNLDESMKNLMTHVAEMKANEEFEENNTDETPVNPSVATGDVDGDDIKLTESDYEEKIVDMPKAEPVDEIASLSLDTENQVLVHYHGDVIAVYPRELFFRDNGDSYDETQIRARLIEYEKNLGILRRVWMAFGWGDYRPDPTLGCPTEEEINNWDLSIDSDEKLGDDPERATNERDMLFERYQDEVERYIANPEMAPRIISRQEFEDECYLDRIFVDYYQADNVFVDNTDADKEMDAFDNFGVSNGKDLFERNKGHADDDDYDPDIVHVKNMKMNFVAEVTRFKFSYASVKDGSAYLNGSTV